MKIALVQMASAKGDIDKNLTETERLIKLAVEQEAKIIVFPEMSLTGYFYEEKDLHFAVSVDHDAVRKVLNLSGKYDCTIIFGIAEKEGEKYFVSQLVAQNGKLSGIYRKHNIVNLEAKIFTAGKELGIFQHGEIKFGITICADIDLLALFADYAKAGCDIVFECASPDLYGDRENRNWQRGYNWWRNNCIEKIGSYAKDNQMAIAVSTQSGRNKENDFPGGGYYFSNEGQILTETKDYMDEILVFDF